MEDRETFRHGDVSPAFSQFYLEKSNSPESSCVSMKSDESMGTPLTFTGGHTSTDLSQFHVKRSNSPESSCVSMKSDQSMEKFNGRHTSTDLRLWDCGVTDEGCAALASALRSNPSNLRKLHLYGNKLGASRVKLLSDGLKDPHCKLEKLWLWDCGVTDEGCVALASALRSNPSHLRELYLSGNELGDPGVKLLSDGLISDPHCKLEKLWLRYCDVTDEGCASLASALRSNPSHLRELYLNGNILGISDVKLLSDLKDDPHYKLETLEF